MTTKTRQHKRAYSDDRPNVLLTDQKDVLDVATDRFGRDADDVGEEHFEDLDEPLVGYDVV